MADQLGDGSPQFSIENGYADESSQAFQLFKMNNLNGWGPISQVITKFEKLLEKYLE